MPDSRHAASRVLCVLPSGKAAIVNDKAGNKAGNSNGGTVGACTSGVVAGWCAQCAEHNAGDCSACAIGMLSQCAAMAAFPTGIAALEHTYAANAVCWNSNATTASNARRSRTRRVGFKRNRMARV